MADTDRTAGRPAWVDAVVANDEGNGGTDTLAGARAALRELVPNLTAAVRSISKADTASVGTWGLTEVAAHLSHVFRFDTDAIAGRSAPLATVTTAGMAELKRKDAG